MQQILDTLHCIGFDGLFLKLTVSKRCAFYNHPRLCSLLLLAGADTTLRDKENNETPYECAVTQKNTELQQILKPILDENVRYLCCSNPKREMILKVYLIKIIKLLKNGKVSFKSFY